MVWRLKRSRVMALRKAGMLSCCNRWRLMSSRIVRENSVSSSCIFVPEDLAAWKDTSGGKPLIQTCQCSPWMPAWSSTLATATLPEYLTLIKVMLSAAAQVVRSCVIGLLLRFCISKILWTITSYVSVTWIMNGHEVGRMFKTSGKQNLKGAIVFTCKDKAAPQSLLGNNILSQLDWNIQISLLPPTPVSKTDRVLLLQLPHLSSRFPFDDPITQSPLDFWATWQYIPILPVPKGSSVSED